MSPSALVIGGQGVLGTFVARGLAEEHWDVFRAGRRDESRSDFRVVDLERPETVSSAIEGIDLVINCVPDKELIAERTVLREGGTIVNIASLPLAVTRGLRLESEGGTGLVVLDAGLLPGVTTTVFRHLLARHPDADRLEYGWASSTRQSTGRSGVALVHQQLGTRHRRQVRTIDFPQPIGRQRCIEWGHGEEGWFGSLADQYRCDAWFYLGPRPVMAGVRLLNRLGALGLLSPRLLGVGRSRVPRVPSQEPKRDVMAVLRGDHRLGAYAMEGTGDYAMTVGATLALVEGLMKLRTASSRLKGVREASLLVEYADLKPGLEGRGVRFTEILT